MAGLALQSSAAPEPSRSLQNLGKGCPRRSILLTSPLSTSPTTCWNLAAVAACLLSPKGGQGTTQIYPLWRGGNGFLTPP